MQFLTCIPVRLDGQPDLRDMGRSLYYYPLVGLLIGIMLCAIALLGFKLNGLLTAALIVAAWVIITGGLHIDGLADTADAWIGGLGSKTRTLAIMQDPACGPMGVVGICLLILLKTIALAALLAQASPYYIVVIPVISRALALALLITTPYVRKDGMGQPLVCGLDDTGKVRNICWLLFAVLALLLICMQLVGLVLTLGAALLLLLWRASLMQRLGGCTGDTIGALIEASELLCLLLLCLVLPG